MKVFAVLFLAQFGYNSYAQTFPREDIDFSAISDELIAYQDEDISYEDALENYIHLFDNPIDLNAASQESLFATNLLSHLQIESLINHIKKHGHLLSIYELQSIEGFDLHTIRKITPFVVVKDGTTTLDRNFFRRVMTRGTSYLVSRYERSRRKSSSYTDPDSSRRFLGSPDKIYLRYRNARTGDYSIGFTSEKDQGEPVAIDPKKHMYGFDYVSWHLQLQNKSIFSNLILGDFRVQFGQGLILGNSFGLGKGGETITSIKRPGSGFVPYTSSSENGYLRGIAATIPIHRFLAISLCYSNTRRDANVAGDELSFSSFLTTGTHRNEVERTDRKTVPEEKAGVVISFRKKTLDVGVISEKTRYHIPVLKKITPYNQFTFSGSELVNFSAYFNYTFRNVNVFGEIGKTRRHGSGLVTGMLLSLSRQLDMSLLYRNYAPDFLALNGNAFSENTSAQNEHGFYWGMKYRFNRRFTLSGYLDLFSFPWLKFRTYAPSEGNELLMRFTYSPSRKTNLTLQARREIKQRNTSAELQAYVIAKGTRHNVAATFDSEIAPHVKIKTRLQYSSFGFDGITTEGFVASQDLSFKLKRLSVSLRHALFDTDDYENRQYVYERDVWLAYSLPAYHGKGIRNIVLIEYKVRSNLSLSTRFSRSYYKDMEEITSGGEKTKGNQLNHIKLQARLSL